MNRDRSRKLLIVICTIALPIVALSVHAFMPPVSRAKLARITAGATQVEAKRILGQPAEVLKPSVFGTEAWRYEVPLRFGWVDVFFDEHSRVIEYNYERF